MCRCAQGVRLQVLSASRLHSSPLQLSPRWLCLVCADHLVRSARLPPTPRPAFTGCPASPPRPPPQRELEAARLEGLRHASEVRRLEAEVGESQRRIRGLTDDLEEARDPLPAAPQGEGVPGQAAAGGALQMRLGRL